MYSLVRDITTTSPLHQNLLQHHKITSDALSFRYPSLDMVNPDDWFSYLAYSTTFTYRGKLILDLILKLHKPSVEALAPKDIEVNNYHVSKGGKGVKKNSLPEVKMIPYPSCQHYDDALTV